MDQQSTGEDKKKISRSTARHLRRKRLLAARKITDNNSPLTQSDADQNISNIQEPDNILTKSKARRLRKKKKAELSTTTSQTLKTKKYVLGSDEQIKLVLNNKSPIQILEYIKSDQNIYGLELIPTVNSYHVHHEEPSQSSLNCSSSDDTQLPRPLNSNSRIVPNDQNVIRVQSEAGSISFDKQNIFSDHNTQNNTNSTFLLQDTLNNTTLNYNKENSASLLKTSSYEKKHTNSELIHNNKTLNENQALTCNENPSVESTNDPRIVNLQSEQLNNSNKKIVKEKHDVKTLSQKEVEDIIESVLHRYDLKSGNSNSSASDNDSDTAKSNLSSCLIDQYEINAIQVPNTLEFVAKTTKTVLNSTEVIKNEKNLKISGNSNSNVAFEPNATAIDLTNYSSRDLIVNNDPTSCKTEEQEIITDLITDSSPDLVQDNQLLSTDHQQLSDAKLQNKNKNHKKSINHNLLNLDSQAPIESSKDDTSLNLIKDYSLPSTSVVDGTLPVIQNLKEPLQHKTIKGLDHNITFNESERTMNPTEKTREQIKAEREAKKAAKALAKSKAKAPKLEQNVDTKSSKDASVKTNNTSDQIQKDAKQNVEKGTTPSEKLRLTTKTDKTLIADNKENELQSKTVDGKSKRESRAERRAKQEAQRAAKEKQIAEKNKQLTINLSEYKSSSKLSDPVKNIVRKTLIDNNLHEVKLFKHLYHERELSLVKTPTLNSNIHPAIVRLGVQYANKVIIGSNARCVALLAATKQLIEDFERPSQADFTRGLEASLQECVAYLHHCRPMAVSMQNALKHLKWQMTQLPTTVSDEDAKSKLGDAIDTYIREQIQLAGEAISNTIQTKISNGDVILTYAFSSLIYNILIDAHNAGKQFRVIVVDGRPWLEGKEQLRRLVKHGIECSYILINALSFIMPEVSKVFLGAHAILANGAVMSRAGTAQVALMAKAFNVPVLVACETHKSCERVQTDSFVYNEIGDVDKLAHPSLNNSKKSPLINWKTKKSLDLLNITFDVTPADLISAVVTERGILPCTSIPVILRIKPSEV